MLKGLNVRGVSEFCRAVALKPQLLLPQVSVKDLNDVSFQALKDRGFQGVIFDKDNTLTIPHHNEIAPHLQQPLDECRRVFGDRVLIFSNSAGSNDDPNFVKATAIEATLGIAVLKHSSKKPGGIEHVRAHFDVVDPATLVMIGDRYSTDILFGNLHGLLTIRTDQFTHDGESVVNRQLQRIEKAVVRLLMSSGVKPIEHPLLLDPSVATQVAKLSTLHMLTVRHERGSVLRILDSKSVEDQSVVANAPRLESFLSTEASERFDAVLRGLDALGISYRRNARLVRGLDYYSHTVFEFVENRTSPDSRNDDDDGDANAVQAAAGSGGIAVLAGGCYDNLSEMLGGPPVSCIGWAAGVDRLHLLRESAVTTSSTIAVVPVLVGDAPDAVLHESMRVAHSLRQRGLAVHFCHGRGNLKKQMKAAEKLGCDHAVILGSDEVAHKFVKVKNLARRQEQQVAAADLDAFDFV